MMKAIILQQAGGPENLVLSDVAQPEIQPLEVLVKVKALSINPVDMKTRNGKAFYEQLKKTPPIILGWDISGEVVAAGPEATKFKEGDEVFGMVNFPGNGRAYAAYVAAPATHFARKPAAVSHQQAAATTLAALTAWQVLVQQAEVKSGEKVFIHAAAGGVGHFAVQIARHLGAYVAGSASAANADFLKELGVHEHIDYNRSRFEEAVQEADMVLDAVGGDTALRSLQVMKKGSRLITIAGSIGEDADKLAKEKGVDARRYLVQSSGEDMEQLAHLLEKGVLKPYIYREYAFEQLPEAHRQIDTGKTRGKLVVSVS